MISTSRIMKLGPYLLPCTNKLKVYQNPNIGQRILKLLEEKVKKTLKDKGFLDMLELLKTEGQPMTNGTSN